MKSKFVVMLAAALATLSVQPAMAQELTGTLKKISETKTLVLGFRESSVPFSYLDNNQKPVGYSMDLCAKVVDAIKTTLKMPALKVDMQPVTSANRIPLLQNGTIDMECGSTTNSVKRQEQVAFGNTTFVTNVKIVVKKNSGIKSLADLNEQPIATTSGTTSVQLIKQNEKGANINFKEIYGKDHAESFLLVANDRAKAFIMDDILIAGLVANSTNPSDYIFLPEVLRNEPYGIMLRKDDPTFKAVVDKTLVGLMKSGEINKIYAKWFESNIPPKNINLKFPMSPELKAAIASPNDKGVE
jgi:glutamate/aspartate transport system substrate-binding protein